MCRCGAPLDDEARCPGCGPVASWLVTLRGEPVAARCGATVVLAPGFARELVAALAEAPPDVPLFAVRVPRRHRG